jgi:hypothetical protein
METAIQWSAEDARHLASKAGAKTEIDFALFANLVSRQEQLTKLLDEIPFDEIPSLRGTLQRCEFFLECGQFFGAQALPKGYRRGKVKECYDNSFTLAISRTGLRYCEGFVVVQLGNDSATDIEHGWCVTPDGKVIDVTLRKPGLCYFGVSYAPKELAAANCLPLTDTIIRRQSNAEWKTSSVPPHSA